MNELTEEEKLLLGIWSEDYDSSSPGDHSLLFYPDKTGRLDIFNWSWCFSYFFNWEIKEGAVNFVGTRTLESEDDGPRLSDDLFTYCFKYSFVEKPGRMHPELTFKVLKLDIPRSPENAEPRVLKFEDFLPDEYGFIREDITGLRYPEWHDPWPRKYKIVREEVGEKDGIAEVILTVYKQGDSCFRNISKACFKIGPISENIADDFIKDLKEAKIAE